MKTMRGRALLVAAAAVAAAGLVALFFVLHPPCAILELFGVQCPACGTTRMLEALMRFDFAAAFAQNPFMLVLLPAVGVVLVWSAVRFIRFERPITAMRGFVPAAAAVLLAAVIFAVCRNLF